MCLHKPELLRSIVAACSAILFSLCSSMALVMATSTHYRVCLSPTSSGKSRYVPHPLPYRPLTVTSIGAKISPESCHGPQMKFNNCNYLFTTCQYMPLNFQSESKRRSFSWFYLCCNLGALGGESGLPILRQSLGFVLAWITLLGE